MRLPVEKLIDNVPVRIFIELRQDDPMNRLSTCTQPTDRVTCGRRVGFTPPVAQKRHVFVVRPSMAG